MALLSLNAVRKSYWSRVVLDELDFAVGPAARVGVVGANGSGKSMLLKLARRAVQAAGGPSIHGRARATLLDLGIVETDLALPTSALSGGQRKLVSLAAYPAFMLAREVELQRQQLLYVTQQKEIERLEEAIRRFGSEPAGCPTSARRRSSASSSRRTARSG